MRIPIRLAFDHHLPREEENALRKGRGVSGIGPMQAASSHVLTEQGTKLTRKISHGRRRPRLTFASCQNKKREGVIVTTKGAKEVEGGGSLPQRSERKRGGKAEGRMREGVGWRTGIASLDLPRFNSILYFLYENVFVGETPLFRLIVCKMRLTIISRFERVSCLTDTPAKVRADGVFCPGFKLLSCSIETFFRTLFPVPESAFLSYSPG